MVVKILLINNNYFLIVPDFSLLQAFAASVMILVPLCFWKRADEFVVGAQFSLTRFLIVHGIHIGGKKTSELQSILGNLKVSIHSRWQTTHGQIESWDHQMSILPSTRESSFLRTTIPTDGI
jgi:hypothetical protein